MGVLGNLLVDGAKKGAKIYAKKKAEEFSEKVEEFNIWTSINPLKAKELNKGENEFIKKLDDERLERKKKEEREFKRNQTKIPLSEDEVRELMKSDAYNNKYNPNHEKVQNQVRVAYENLFPDDDRNENPENYYIWKTVGDGRTRSSHLERDGEVFCWDNPPEGGHPGEDYGCRCEAEPYVPPKHND